MPDGLNAYPAGGADLPRDRERGRRPRVGRLRRARRASSDLAGRRLRTGLRRQPARRADRRTPTLGRLNVTTRARLRRGHGLLRRALRVRRPLVLDLDDRRRAGLRLGRRVRADHRRGRARRSSTRTTPSRTSRAAATTRDRSRRTSRSARSTAAPTRSSASSASAASRCSTSPSPRHPASSPTSTTATSRSRSRMPTTPRRCCRRRATSVRRASRSSPPRRRRPARRCWPSRTRCRARRRCSRSPTRSRSRMRAAPTVSGAPDVTKTLVATPGEWNAEQAIAFAYQWLRDGSPIAGATKPEYQVKSADQGHALSVRVTASGLGRHGERRQRAGHRPVSRGGDRDDRQARRVDEGCRVGRGERLPGVRAEGHRHRQSHRGGQDVLGRAAPRRLLSGETRCRHGTRTSPHALGQAAVTERAAGAIIALLDRVAFRAGADALDAAAERSWWNRRPG